MKMGFVSAILHDFTFEETLDAAAKLGFSCVEIACWPSGKAERRYAGVSHLNVTNMYAERAAAVKDFCTSMGVSISALAYYPNPMDGDLERRNFAAEHLKKVIEAADVLDVGMVTTFAGRDQRLGVEENIKLFETIWPPIIEHAEKHGVRVAIENCPMLFGPDQWPGGQNLFTSPSVWRRLFEIIPSNNFGVNFDPSHFVWQMMDYITPIYEFADRIFHIHFKDIKVHWQRLRDVGTMASPLEFMSPKLPGLGDINWGAFVSALNDIGYDGPACIEVEDRAYEESRERVVQSLVLSKRYLEQFVV